MLNEEKKELIRIVSSLYNYGFCEGMMYPNNEHEKEEVNKYWNQLYEFLDKLTKN